MILSPVFFRCVASAALLTACCHSTAYSQKQRAQVAPPAHLSLSSYLNYEPVRIELNLDADQRREVDALKRVKLDNSRKDFEELRKAPQAERRKKLAELAARRMKRRAAVEKRVLGILNNTQQTRLREIAIQLGGSQAFCTQELIAELKLSKQQNLKMNAIRGERSTEIRKIVLGRGDGPEGTKAMLKTINDLEGRLTKKAVEVLTAKQKAIYQKMIGKEFDRSKLAGGRL